MTSLREAIRKIERIDGNLDSKSTKVKNILELLEKSQYENSNDPKALCEVFDALNNLIGKIAKANKEIPYVDELQKVRSRIQDAFRKREETKSKDPKYKASPERAEAIMTNALIDLQLRGTVLSYTATNYTWSLIDDQKEVIEKKLREEKEKQKEAMARIEKSQQKNNLTLLTLFTGIVGIVMGNLGILSSSTSLREALAINFSMTIGLAFLVTFVTALLNPKSPRYWKFATMLLVALLLVTLILR